LLLGAGLGAVAISAVALLSGASEVAEGPKLPATPSALELRTTIPIRGAPLRVGLEPAKQPIAVGMTQPWSVLVASAQGAPLSGCKVTFNATMPEHGHGLPTAPRVEGESAPGRYRLEGLRFSMAGYWQVDVDATCDEGTQRALFDLRL
jgi:hypothetical protein